MTKQFLVAGVIAMTTATSAFGQTAFCADPVNAASSQCTGLVTQGQGVGPGGVSGLVSGGGTAGIGGATGLLTLAGIGTIIAIGASSGGGGGVAGEGGGGTGGTNGTN